jgi:hypothetical protein
MDVLADEVWKLRVETILSTYKKHRPLYLYLF